jgi:hypothetical protein
MFSLDSARLLSQILISVDNLERQAKKLSPDFRPLIRAKSSLNNIPDFGPVRRSD